MPFRTIILYGQSMLLSLVAASLEKNANLHALQAANWDEVLALAQHCLPDVLMYEIGASSENHILPLLFLNPHMLLIGLDVETNRALLVTGKETRSLTMSMVEELILSV